jgi:hypothetical protein
MAVVVYRFKAQFGAGILWLRSVVSPCPRKCKSSFEIEAVEIQRRDSSDDWRKFDKVEAGQANAFSIK